MPTKKKKSEKRTEKKAGKKVERKKAEEKKDGSLIPKFRGVSLRLIAVFAVADVLAIHRTDARTGPNGRYRLLRHGRGHRGTESAGRRAGVVMG